MKPKAFQFVMVCALALLAGCIYKGGKVVDGTNLAIGMKIPGTEWNVSVLDYIGGIRVCGTINDAPSVVNALNVDAVVVACRVSDDWLKVVREILRPTGVKLTLFSFSETPVAV